MMNKKRDYFASMAKKEVVQLPETQTPRPGFPEEIKMTKKDLKK